MNLTLQFYIQIGGILQLITAAANFFLPAKLHYRENLAKVSPIIRQIFIVHAAFIVLAVIGFAAISLFFSNDLCGASALGKYMCGFLAIFWGARAVLQFTYYDKAIKQAHPLGALFFGTIFLYLGVVFTAATLFSK